MVADLRPRSPLCALAPAGDGVGDGPATAGIWRATRCAMLRTTVVMWREVDVVSAAPHIGAEPALAPPGSANGTAPPDTATASSQSRSPAAIGLVNGATSS